MRRILSLSSAEAPATAPETITVYREPPGPVPGSAFCESAYVTTIEAGSTSNSSATTWRDDGLGAVPPHRLRVQRDDDLAGGVDREARALGARGGRELRVVEPEPELRRAEHAPLLRGDDADPDVAALGPRLVPVGDPALVVDCLQHLLEHALVVAAVVDVPGRGAVRELAGRDQVAAADLDAVEAELARGHVDEALEHPVGDLGAEAAVGALLVLVRQHGARASTRRAGSGTGRRSARAPLPCVPVPNWR